MDIPGWTKGQQWKHCKEVNRQLIPQQLAIGVDGQVWMGLSRAHHSDCAQPSGVYMRDATAARGLKQVCEGRAGGPQGSALTCIVFPILLDGILKETEQRFPVFETKAIQNDVSLYGDPAIILGGGGALDFILAEFQKADLKPNLKKFQAYTTSPEELREESP